MNIADDGIVGKETLQHLKSLKRIIISKETSNFPIINKSPGKETKLRENRIILDYSENLEDTVSSEKYLNEKIYICRSIVNFCRDMLIKKGIETLLSSGENESPNLFLYDRIEYANRSGVDLLVGVDLNYSEDKDANGCSCFYFKGLKSYSLSGYRIANIVQDKIIGNLKVLDCRVHGANYAVLKATTMTSVLVEPGFISNYTERERIKKTGYQMKISESIVEAILEYLSE
jgi:N-acetylmuramoyl-L-alanine amidase